MGDRGGKARAGRPGAPSDLTLLAQAARAGSSDDLDSFVKACWQDAYGAAIRFECKHHGAEDSAQEAAIVVYRLLKLKPPKLDPESVGALVRTVVLRHVQQGRTRLLLEAKAMQLALPRREALAAAREVETEEWARRVHAAIATLAQPLRRLIELRHWDGMSTRAVAREVRMSETSIRRLLAEAEAAIEHELRRLAGTEGDAATPLRQPGGLARHWSAIKARFGDVTA
jgi:RNA polymerase sigma factor (sigma-70 family)